MNFLVLKNDQVIKTKKWHKKLLKNAIKEVEDSCPLVNFKNKKLLVYLKMHDNFNTEIVFKILRGDKEMEVFLISSILHKNEEILQIGSNYGLVTY